MGLNAKLTYADILNKLVSYKLEERTADADEVKLKITDGKFTTHSAFQIRKSVNSKTVLPYLEKNEGLQAISGNCRLFLEEKNGAKMKKRAERRRDLLDWLNYPLLFFLRKQKEA